MKNGLTRSSPIVQDRAVAVRQLALRGKFRGDKLQFAEHGRVLGGGIGQRSQMLARADEDVAGRLRLNILEGKNIRVFVYEFRGDFFFSDFAEKAVGHGVPRILQSTQVVEKVESCGRFSLR